MKDNFIMTRFWRSKPFFLRICLLLLFTGWGILWSQSPSPNIIVILSDDQGWGDFSFQGNTNLSTPNVDKMVREGALFKRFYVSSVCSPTRAEFLTGRYHPRSGVHGTSEGAELMALEQTTIAEIFKEAGYRTAVFGKWHNGSQFPYHPLARGFDEFYGFTSGHWGNYFSPWLEHNGDIVKGKGYLTNDLTDHAIAFMNANRTSPYFLYLAYNTPHAPMQVPDQWWEKQTNTSLHKFADERVEEDTMFTKAALAMCENIDWNVGRIMDLLEKTGQADNTIILYFTDNGPNSWRWNGGMKGRKGSTDEGGVRSPLIMRWPGHISSGLQVDENSAAIDLLPTLTDLAGIPARTEKPLDGISLKPLLMDRQDSWPDRLVFSHWRGRTGVRNQRFILDNKNMLFDLENDPGQRKDVSAEYPDVKNELLKTKYQWEKEVIPDTFPSPVYFPAGHPAVNWTYLPARDGQPHGHIQRSNRWPNCSFFTNWTSREDSITWNVEVLEEGDYSVELYYTCTKDNVGSQIRLALGDQSVTTTISEAFDPSLRGMEHDRIERWESYVKDFREETMGTIHLEKGKDVLTMKALKIPGEQAIDVRLLKLTRSD